MLQFSRKSTILLLRLWRILQTTTLQRYPALLTNKSTLTRWRNTNVGSYSQASDSCTCCANSIGRLSYMTNGRKVGIAGWRGEDGVEGLTCGLFACRWPSSEACFRRFTSCSFLLIHAWTSEVSVEDFALAPTEDQDGFESTFSTSTACKRAIISFWGGRVGTGCDV